MIIRNILIQNQLDILSWIEHQNQKYNHSVLYSSIDIRQSTHKVVPVDINLFPSGFNNFKHQTHFLQREFKVFLKNIITYHHDAYEKPNIALMVENFTRNENYLNNIKVLQNIFDATSILTIHNNEILDFVNQNIIQNINDFDIIILNNDLNSGCPTILKNYRGMVLPSYKYGWYNRRKHIHLNTYNMLINEMIKDLKINCDSWLLQTIINRHNNIDFKGKIGLEILAETVDQMLQLIQKKYLEHKIDTIPHVFIKANNGTFGMGIMVVKSASEILNLNKKYRHSMHTLKYGMQNSDVILQEGVETALINSYNNPTEKVLYNFNDNIVGRLTRYNANKNTQSNLNSNGMQIAIDNEFDIVDKIIAQLCNLTTKIEYNVL